MADPVFRLSVDYGTSNTVAVLAEPGRPSRPLLVDGRPQLPSAVCLNPAGSLLVGQAALYMAQFHPESFEPYPKRHIDEDILLLGGREVPVGDAIAAVYRQVATEFARVTGGTAPGEVVLTHPAAWGAARQETLLRAAYRAGWVRPRLVAEPVAAAAAFVAGHEARLPVGAHALVYDLGAGTFDVAIVRRDAAGFVVRVADGLDDVGGADIDHGIVSYLTSSYSGRVGERIRELSQPTTPEQRRTRWRFLDDVRTAKELLATTPGVFVRIPGVDDGAPLGREELDRITRPLLDRTLHTTSSLLARAGLGAADIHATFLVGGATRLPLVATLLHQALQRPPVLLEQPELVVAEGGLHAVAPPAALSVAAVPPAASSVAVASTVPHGTADAGPVAAPAGGIRGLARRRSTRIGAAAAVLVLLTAGGAIAAVSGRDQEPTPQPTRPPGYAHAGTLLTGRPACVAAWNPAGTHYAVTSADIGLEIYQRDGKLLRTFPVQLARNGRCYLNHPAIYWTSDGVTVAVIGGSEPYREKLHLFNVETGDMTVARTGSQPVYDPPTWHPDGSALLVHLGRRIVVAGPDGRPDRNLFPDGLETVDYSARSISIAPVGDMFAVTWYDAGQEDGPLFEIRRFSDGSLVTTVGRASESGEAELLAYHPAGNLVAVGINEFGVEVWETAGWSRVATLYGPTGSITDVRWSGNGEYLLATSHGHQKVHVFRTGDWQTVGELGPHEESRRKIGVYAGTVDNNGRVLLVPQGPRGIDVFDLS
ncbi:Hsp70 family protein [Solwaraspora sp. WMMD1047]|uniref:Hsp70 family protein n=1 Tax=Solwaraspora sp. WMMD1047 TaxID=3016102 RepID=UPI0024164224|nr:Hsp70 family protein [Solwaraspora sp. WMMD1047]MDG4829076.1 Hsp70 family protein [Solwaraspora sp. WMMD1047]